jgi:hypothetical protein
MRQTKNKYLIIKGIAGLGNRLITLCSGIEYARTTDRILLVDWSDGMYAEKGHNVFYDYFKLVNVKYFKNIRNISHISSVYPAGFNRKLDKGVHELYKNINAVDAGIPKIYSILDRVPQFIFSYQKPNMLREYWRYIYFSGRNNNNINGLDYFFGIFNNAHSPCGRHLSKKRKEDIVIYIEYEPSYNPVTLLNHINLQSAISKKIDLFTSEKLLTHDSIGVHIRGNDRKSKTPYEKLYNLLRDKKFETKKIFLATDCIEVLENFLKEFPNTIVYPKFLPKVHERGIHYWASTKGSTDKAKGILEQSIIDIWLLSKCEYLFYQKSSSFSKIAFNLHNNFHKAVNWEDY